MRTRTLVTSLLAPGALLGCSAAPRARKSRIESVRAALVIPITMRSTLLFSLSLGLFSIACSSSDSAGTTSNGDASCGTDAPIGLPDASRAETGLPDGGPADAASNDATPDVTQPVTVNVVSPSGPRSGITIVFQDARGSVIASGVTDANGRYAAIVPSGSQATALLGTSHAPSLFTIVGTEPGDVLTAVDWPSVDTTVSATAIPAPLPAGVDHFDLRAGGCTGLFTKVPGVVAAARGCMSADGKIPLLLTAEDSASAPIAFAFQKGNVLAPNGAGIDEISLAGATWSPQSAARSHVVSVTGAPTEMPTVISFSEVADGVPFASTNVLAKGTDAGAASATFAWHSGFADSVQAEASWNETAFRNSGAKYVEAVAQRSGAPTAAASTSLDLSVGLGTIVDASINTYFASRPLVQWSGASDANQGDIGAGSSGIVTLARWTGPSADGGVVNGTWTMVLPPSATNAQAPSLPPAAAAWAPAQGASFLVPTVSVIKASTMPDYASFRAHAASFPAPSKFLDGPVVPPVDGNGTVHVTMFVPLN